MASPPRRRLPLSRSSRRIGYERRLRILVWLLFLPLVLIILMILFKRHATISVWLVTMLVSLTALWMLHARLIDQLLRPLQTLSNVVAALREEDYSFRARGARRGDALGDLALEINALASDLQSERLSSLEAAALIRRVLESIDAPVIAFDEQSRLRLLNPAAIEALALNPRESLNRSADDLGLGHLLEARDKDIAAVSSSQGSRQWMLRRSLFRQHGAPHTLILLSDVSAVLRQEERQAWQRLIRVMGHEINNSLTPIKSIAGTLRSMLHEGSEPAEFLRPLEVIEQRADSLNRFLSAYRQLAQLPPPNLEVAPLAPLVHQLALLETRITLDVKSGPPVLINIDRDQISQALINLMRNATEAALENKGRAPNVSISWRVDKDSVVILIHDTGLGLANPHNLFVPFYTTKQGGSGIGLTLAKAIIEAHGGSITLRNRADFGAVAELRFSRFVPDDATTTYSRH